MAKKIENLSQSNNEEVLVYISHAPDCTGSLEIVDEVEILCEEKEIPVIRSKRDELLL